jgi:uncharacterized protein (TIGR03437 family)
MRELDLVLALLLSIAPAVGQQLVNRSVLSGNGSDQPSVIATDSNGFVYVAGSTTSGNFPVTNGLESMPPQGSLNVSINGASFVNAGLTATGVSAVAASSDGTLVIASTSTGIFRSTDRGLTWTAAANVVPPAAALAVDPANSSNAYALSQQGAFYKSANGGVNWKATGASLPPMPQSTIAIAPGTPSTLYTLANGLIYRSTDGGQSWQSLAVPNSVNAEPVVAFALAPSQPDVMYATGISGYGPGPLYKSTDGGTTWTTNAQYTVANGPVGSLAVDPTNPSVVWIASDGEYLQRSTDGGATFQNITTLNFGDGLATSVAIDPTNPSRVYASDGSNVFETSDGGQTWSTVYTGYSGSLYATPSRVYAVGGNVPQTVFLAKFDATLSQVVYSTYLWTGTVSGIAVDALGDVYLAGAQSDGTDGMVMKVSAADSSVLYSAPLLGAVPAAIAIDASGDATIAGTASSLPVTKGAYQTKIPGPCTIPINYFDAFPNQESTHAFVAKLNASGALVDATYVTGSCGETAYAVALDSSGAVYVAGETYSPDFPVTADALIAKFPSTYSAGFLAKLSPAEDQLLYSTFVGGGNFSAVHALVLDGANVYLGGSTQASPTAGAGHSFSVSYCPQPGPEPGPSFNPPPIAGDNPFVMKMTLSAAPPIILANVGGSCSGETHSIAFDAAGNIWLAGSNLSWGFPSVVPISGLGQIPAQQLDYIGSTTGFLAEMNPSGTTLLSATVTDSFGAVTADAAAVYYAGGLGDLSTSGLATGSYAALVAQINPTQLAPIFIDEITQLSPLLPAASLQSSAVAPGEIVRIVGRGLGPQNQAGARLTPGGTMATSIGGVQVTFNGVPAPLVTAQSNLVVAIAPFELTGLSSAAVQVQYNGFTSNTYPVPVVAQNPDIVAVVNSDWSANSQTNPAKGGVAAIFLTGLGQTNVPGVDGAINQPPLAQPVVMPDITNTGNYAVNVTFLGAAAGEVAGVSQLNIGFSGPLVPTLGQPLNPAFIVTIGGASVTVYAAQ